VPHPGHRLKTCARDERGQGLAVQKRQQRVVGAVDDEGGGGDVGERASSSEDQ
jgi:hypothetical protein